MTFYKFCFLVFTHVLIANAQWTIEDESCRTPSGSPGDCIQIFSCKFIMNILETVSQPIPRNVSSMLKAHHCGFSGKDPKVCCPKPKEDQTEQRNAVAPPPDVSKHKNYGLLPRSCGIVDTGDKIIHGNQTGLFEFPWMALLSYRTNRGPEFKCGATIISSRYILTAAHCITNLKNPLLGVRIGDHNTETQKDCETTRSGEQICAPPYQDVAIEEIIPHPDYQSKNKNLANDIGLLRVTEMNINQENIRPVCLPLEKARNYNYTNRNTLVTGWGATEQKRSSPELLKAQIPVVSNEQCKEIYINETVINHKQLCAGGKTSSDSCAGDSGGPLHVLANVFGDNRLVQQGIVSFGPKFCGLRGYPGVYTRVAYYMDWILDTMRP